MADETTRVVDLPVKATSNISLADYLMGIDAAEGYQMLIGDLARKIIETYTGSSLAGSAQTLKAALDGLNTKIGSDSMGTTATSVTGAIAEHESDINGTNGINAKIGNATMGTDATTLTGAIAEHEEDISELNSKTHMIIRSYTASASGIAPGSIAGFSANDFNATTPSGYTPVAVVSYSSGNATGSVYQISATATGAARMMSIRNVGSSSSDYSPSIVILYAKTGMIV